MQPFREISPNEIPDNVFTLIDKDWFLITAGKPENFNTMTASWGTLGILWHRPIATVFIRPQRYTYQFAEEQNIFTCSFFTNDYRKALQYCGSNSGRDVDKIKETGLSPEFSTSGGIYFKEARLVLQCRKIYYDDLKPDHFLDPKIQKNYPINDYHRFFIGEIENCLIK